jgi:hypothetical protein
MVSTNYKKRDRELIEIKIFTVQEEDFEEPSPGGPQGPKAVGSPVGATGTVHVKVIIVSAAPQFQCSVFREIPPPPGSGENKI